MATWEDGPEYAPLQRPDNFSEPTVEPLEIVPAAPQSAALAPKDRPQFDSPSAPVAPLSTLVPVVADERDPGLPFAVASSTLTSMDSAWGSAHWSPPGPQPTTWPPPQNAAAAFPPPGTPQWFGPGPVAPQQPPPVVLDAKAVFTAATPGLLICLALSVLWPLAPILFGVAFFLSSRVTVAQQQVRQAFLIAFGFLGFFALAGLASDGWWSFLSVSALVICWSMLVTVLILVYRALKRRGPPAPRYTSNWG